MMSPLFSPHQQFQTLSIDLAKLPLPRRMRLFGFRGFFSVCQQGSARELNSNNLIPIYNRCYFLIILCLESL
jgi:hypothetical protein